MQTITLEWKNHDDRVAEAILRAQECGATHFRFLARGTMLQLGCKEELKAAGKGAIYSALPYNAEDPETWGAQWIPNCTQYDCRKDLKMWSDEYEARRKGLALRKGVGR